LTPAARGSELTALGRVEVSIARVYYTVVELELEANPLNQPFDHAWRDSDSEIQQMTETTYHHLSAGFLRDTNDRSRYSIRIINRKNRARPFARVICGVLINRGVDRSRHHGTYMYIGTVAHLFSYARGEATYREFARNVGAHIRLTGHPKQ
jgi:hypothetical protein